MGLSVYLSGTEIKSSFFSQKITLSSPLKVDFSSRSTPSFIETIEGVSSPEVWGRWSEHSEKPEVSIIFKNELPNAFKLQLDLNAFGPNVNQPAIIRVGDVERSIVIDSDQRNYILNFDGVLRGTKVIQIKPYKPISPMEFDNKLTDTRKIAIGLIRLTITTP